MDDPLAPLWRLVKAVVKAYVLGLIVLLFVATFRSMWTWLMGEDPGGLVALLVTTIVLLAGKSFGPTIYVTDSAPLAAGRAVARHTHHHEES